MTKKKTDEEFKQEVYDLVGNEYTVLSEYQGGKNKVKLKHNKCEHEYDVRPNNFLRGQRCPYCNGNSKKTAQQFKDEVFNLVGNEYSVLSDYTNAKTKVKIRHNKCGNAFDMKPNNFLNGQRCPYEKYSRISQTKTKTTQQFKDEVYDLVGDEYLILSEYINNRTKVLVKHNKCGYEYRVTPDNFLRGTRCPKCYQSGTSHGNEYIAKYLDEHDIKYSREYRFDGCVYKSPLPFDFYLPYLDICIEYDGEQHYVRNDFFEKHDPFKERQIKDRIKSKYCYQNDIKLIRIKYTQFNEIDDILNKELKTK